MVIPGSMLRGKSWLSFFHLEKFCRGLSDSLPRYSMGVGRWLNCLVLARSMVGTVLVG